ncbi:MAG: FG-GAP-like repeat-containing protein [Candidatus Latescibacterota bacterium]
MRWSIALLLLAAPAAWAEGLFGPAAYLPTGIGPVWVHAVDLDGNGAPDLVSADEDDGTLSLFFNEERGTFARRVRLHLGGGPSSIASADFDGDSRTDLAVSDWVRSRIVLLRNLGNGELVVAGEAPAERATQLLAADLTGDAAPDLLYLSGNWASRLLPFAGTRVRLLVGEGSWSFRPADLPQPAHPTEELGAADLDGDGDLDVVAVSEGGDPGAFTILRNDGSGGFGTGPAPPPNTGPAGPPWDLPDGASVSLWLARGDGALAAEAVRPYTRWDFVTLGTTAADLDGDGWPEVAYQPVRFLEGRGRERHGLVSVLRNVEGRQLELADTCAVGQVTSGPGSVFGLYRARLIAVDLDRDGDLDLVGTRRTEASLFLLHNLRLQPRKAPPVARALGPVRAWVGDEVTLDGSESRDPEGGSVQWRWRQVAGARVSLQTQDEAQTRFVAPGQADSLQFELTVEDAAGAVGRPDTVAVPVMSLAYAGRLAPAGDGAWELGLPAGAPVRALVVDHTQRSVVYAATAGQGIYRSEDGGSTWRPANDGLADLSLRALAMHPVDRDRLYAIDGEYRLLHTADGGATWHPLETEGRPAYAGLLAFAGTELYVLGRGLQRWDHEGTSMRDVNYDMSEDDTGQYVVTGFAVDPFDPRVRYALTEPWGVSLDRSTDGMTWEWGITRPAGFYPAREEVLFVSPTTGWVYLAGRSGTLHRSRRLGETWDEVSGGLPEGVRVRCLAADPADTGAVYLGLDQGVYWSHDGSDPWQPLSGPGAGSGGAQPSVCGPAIPGSAPCAPGAVQALAVAGSRQRWLLAGTEDGQVYRLALGPGGVTAVAGDGASALPGATRLLPCAPNPCNARTRIRYELGSPGPVDLAVYDVLGQRVAGLVHAVEPAGRHAVGWDATAAAGRPLGSGVYLVRLRAGDGVCTGRLLLLR